MFKIQPRRIAKFAATVTTTAVVATAADAALTTVMDESDDDTNHHTGSLLIGCVIGQVVKNRTDRMVDWVADRKPRQNKNETTEVAEVI